MQARKSWAEKEQEENRRILRKFWEMRVKAPNRNEESINAIKNQFLVAAPANDVDAAAWVEQLNVAWKNPSTFESFDNFWEYFKHVPSLKNVGIAENLLLPKKEMQVSEISADMISDLEQYTHDKDFSISAIIGSARSKTASFSTKGNDASDVLSMHSVGKIFTGVLLLRLVQEGIISENDLNSKIQIAESARESLQQSAPKVLMRLDEVTLHQALTHQAGLGVGEGVKTGDYVRNYGDAIETAIDSHAPVPVMHPLSEYFQYIPDQVSPIGQYRYSNTGFLIGGLSIEHLYEMHTQKHPELRLEALDFNGLMQKYVIQPAGMNMFQYETPNDFKYNHEHRASKFLAGGPAGGSFSTTEDLAKFAQWLYRECQAEPKEGKLSFIELLNKYGQEFFHDNRIEHAGDSPAGSAFLSVNVETGNIVVVMNDQRALAASEVGRAVQDNLFLQSDARRSWYDQEDSNISGAENCKPEILSRFWAERIAKRNDVSISLIKGFIKGRPPHTWKGQEVDRDAWSNIVDIEFTSILRADDKQRFFQLFQHISGRDVLDIDKGENFGISWQNLPREEVSRSLSIADEEDISRYMDDKKMSATLSVYSQGQTSEISSDENTSESIFSIHSVGKVFTGVIILDLIDRGILSEDALNKPIKISEAAKKKLPPSIVERLKLVTLHDVMVHKGGFGDFVGNYVGFIKEVINKNSENPDLPSITNIEDFLQFANDELSKPGETRYSNLGSLLVGLAAEHAHAEYCREHKEERALEFNGMLKEFIQVPAGMQVLLDRSPVDAKVNDSQNIEEPTPEARHLVGNPSGGYWTSVSDLSKFGTWLSNKCMEPNFGRLVQRYGQEFHLDKHTLGHKGESPSASAMLSISLTDGRVIAALSNSGRNDAHILEEAVRLNAFTKQVMSLNEDSVKESMRQAEIPAISVAYVSNGEITDKKGMAADGSVVPEEQMFGAASLSKPVFAYLVLKLINRGEFSLDTKLDDLLPFKKFCEENEFKFDDTVTGEVLNDVTVRMMLSHTSGLNLPNNKPIDSQFQPGTEYSYSNLGLYYLQKAIEHKLRTDLQSLAQKHVFAPLHMDNTCYYRDYDLCPMANDKYEAQKIYINCIQDGVKTGSEEKIPGCLEYKVVGLDGKVKNGSIPWDKLPKDFPRNTTAIIANKDKYLPVLLNHTSANGYTTCKDPVAVNSLFTTAHDYGLFVNAWLNDKSELMQSAFKPIISMTNDDWAKKLKVPQEDLSKVAWGLGWGLQTTYDGKRSTHAYHTADMNMWRAQVAIDIDNKRAIVYFANSKNGHILADQIISPNVKIDHALNYFFQKYGFARQIEANWQAKEDARMQHIGAIVDSRNVVKSQVRAHVAPAATAEPKRDSAEKPTMIKSVKSRASELNDADARSSNLSGSKEMYRRLGVKKPAADSRKVEKSGAQRSNPSKPKDGTKKSAESVAHSEDQSHKSTYKPPKPSGFSTKLTRDPRKK